LKLIKIEVKCPSCEFIHELEVPILSEWETGTLRCLCNYLIEFEIEEVIKN